MTKDTRRELRSAGVGAQTGGVGLAATPPACDGRLLLIEVAIAPAAVEERGLLGGCCLRRLGRVEDHRVWHRRNDGCSCWTMLVLLAVIARSKAAVKPATIIQHKLL